MRLTKITMKSFAPFADGEMEFDTVKEAEGLAEVHLFTGENGTGKTRVLAALMGALGNVGPLQDRVRQDSGAEIEVVGISAAPPLDEKVKLHRDSIRSRIAAGLPRLQAEFVQAAQEEHDAKIRIKTWRFRNGIEDVSAPSLTLQDDSAFALAGAGIALLEEAKVTTGAETKASRAVERLSLSSPVGGSGITQRLMNLRMRVALERDSGESASSGRLTTCLIALEKSISVITGQSFFILVETGREIRLMVQWGGTKLYFSELPDGLRSLLNWLAGWVVLQTEHYDEAKMPLLEPVTLILDEPENHLHPAWQRRVLPAVQKLFPKAQMFVVTHSPFVVSSLNTGWIHKFTRDEAGVVKIETPKKASRGDSYMTAVQEILDLTEWFDPETEQEIADFETSLDKAYENNGNSVDEMRLKADKLSKRSTEVTNLVAGLVAQFDRTVASQKKEPAVQQKRNIKL